MAFSLQLLWGLLPLVGFPCPYGFVQPCGASSQGACRKGVQVCMINQWGPCLCEQPPVQEICDCKDNDCDGLIDENCSCGCPGTTRHCGFSDKGQCKGGVQTCIGLGQWGLCKGTIGPGKERCDQIDNDCDGMVDEDDVCAPCNDGDVQDCFSLGSRLIGEGPCKAGQQTCRRSKWGPCVGEILPTAEICDNIDNDCNGLVDGMVRLCGQDKGVCQKGSQICELGKWGPCLGEITPTPEICDCKDNDCDGTVDENVSCPSGQICYYGRCIPNCLRGECIFPSENPTEPTPEPVLERPITEVSRDTGAEPSSDMGELKAPERELSPEPTTEPVPADAGPGESSEQTQDVRIDAVVTQDKANAGEDLRGPDDGIQVSVGGCRCDASRQRTVGGLWWLCALGILLVIGLKRR